MHSGGNGGGSPHRGFQVSLNFNAEGDLASGVFLVIHVGREEVSSSFKEQGWGWPHLKPPNSFSGVTNKV